MNRIHQIYHLSRFRPSRLPVDRYKTRFQVSTNEYAAKKSCWFDVTYSHSTTYRHSLAYAFMLLDAKVKRVCAFLGG